MQVIPVACGSVFCGQRPKDADVALELGAPEAPGCELLAVVDQISQSGARLLGPDLPELVRVGRGTAVPFGLLAEVSGSQVDADVATVLERQLHRFLNELDGVSHGGRGSSVSVRVTWEAASAGLGLGDMAEYVEDRLRSECGRAIEQVRVTVMTDNDEVAALRAQAALVRAVRERRICRLRDDEVDVFFSCTICQSIHPSHVCVLAPERPGMCGVYGWLEAKAFYRLVEAGPCRPIAKGRLVHSGRGAWEGVNAECRRLSHGAVGRLSLYSLLEDPLPVSSSAECVTGVLPACNGVFTVDHFFRGACPLGLSYAELVYLVSSGSPVPGFTGHSQKFVGHRRFLQAEGGIRRLVWMPRRLKELLRDQITAAAAVFGLPRFYDMIATEEQGTEERDIRRFLEEVGHPALRMNRLV